MECVSISLSRHALQRMFERGLSGPDIENVVATREAIEDFLPTFHIRVAYFSVFRSRCLFTLWRHEICPSRTHWARHVSYADWLP